MWVWPDAHLCIECHDYRAILADDKGLAPRQQPQQVPLQDMSWDHYVRVIMSSRPYDARGMASKAKPCSTITGQSQLRPFTREMMQSPHAALGGRDVPHKQGSMAPQLHSHQLSQGNWLSAGHTLTPNDLRSSSSVSESSGKGSRCACSARQITPITLSRHTVHSSLRAEAHKASVLPGRCRQMTVQIFPNIVHCKGATCVACCRC